MGAGTEVVVNSNTKGSTNKAFLAVIGIIFLLGFGFWIKQITVGFSGYSAQYAWGLYIAAFFTAVAGGAGTMIVASIAKVMDMMEESKSKQYYTAAIAMFVMAGFFILADLGSPLNIFKLIFTSNGRAPMVLDFWLLMACVVICLLAVFLGGEKKTLSLVGLVSAVLLLSVESWLVTSANVQELWGSAMGAGPAFIQAAIMAFALLLILDQNSKYVKMGLTFALFLFLAVSLTDLMAGLADKGHLGLQWAEVSGSVLFWTGVVLGAIVPLVVLMNNNNIGKFSAVVVSLLAILGVLLTKQSYIWSAQAVPAIDGGVTTAAVIHMEEVIIVVGFTALGILVYYALNKRKGGLSA